jgi:hypothetical protein
VGVPARGTVRMEAIARTSGASARVVVLRGRRSFASARRGVLRLKLTKRGRRLLSHRRRVRLTLRASFTDRAGNRARASSSVGLTRRGRR